MPATGTGGERRYRGMTAEDRRADRRRRLLGSALELVGTRGYAQTTIEEICSRAGVTARHFYESFPSREDLLLALYDEIVAEHAQAVAEALAVVSGPLERFVRTGVETAVRAWIADERKARIAFIEVVGVSERVEERRFEVLDRYGAFTAAQADRLAGEGLIPRRDRTLTGPALVGATTQLLASWLHGPQRAPIAAIIDELVAVQLAVLRDG